MTFTDFAFTDFAESFPIFVSGIALLLAYVGYQKIRGRRVGSENPLVMLAFIFASMFIGRLVIRVMRRWFSEP